MKRFPKIGAQVLYHPVIGGPNDGKIYTVVGTGFVGENTRIAWLEGKRGCVAIHALSNAKKRGDK